MKNYGLIAAVLIISGVALASAAGVFTAMRDIEKSGKAEQAPATEFTAALTGFVPGSRVIYKVFEPFSEANVLSGEEIVGDDGRLAIPAYGMDKYENIALTYDLMIEEEERDDPLNMVLTLNSETGKLSVLGHGLEQFTAVRMESQDDVLETRADWAGLISVPLDIELGNDGEVFEIAFFGNDFMGGIETQHPKIIQVLEAPGGGGPTGAGVNQYNPTHCGGAVPYSWCNPGWMLQHINYIVNNYVAAMMYMTTQFSAVMSQQVQIIGAFLDAKFQLESQRDFQLAQAQAHKDYHPSAQMCQFGSFTKSIARSEEKSALDKQVLNAVLMGQYQALEHLSTAEGYATDIESRISNFRITHCDLDDNTGQNDYICDHDQALGAGPSGATNDERINKDIDYARTLAMPLTLAIDFNAGAASADEEDIIALGRNLYWPQAIEPGISGNLPGAFNDYQDARRLFAMQNVAHNTFVNIVGQKSSSETGLGADSGWNFMKSLMRDFGISDPEIHELMGDYPSYYAQMEVLTKKIYQNPDFYTNLYDKPVNVRRIGASIDAISLMQNRDLFESSLRREMLLSMLVEEALARHIEDLNGKIAKEMKSLR